MLNIIDKNNLLNYDENTFYLNEVRNLTVNIFMGEDENGVKYISLATKRLYLFLDKALVPPIDKIQSIKDKSTYRVKNFELCKEALYDLDDECVVDGWAFSIHLDKAGNNLYSPHIFTDAVEELKALLSDEPFNEDDEFETLIKIELFDREGLPNPTLSNLELNGWIDLNLEYTVIKRFTKFCGDNKTEYEYFGIDASRGIDPQCYRPNRGDRIAAPSKSCVIIPYDEKIIEQIGKYGESTMKIVEWVKSLEKENE